jgi:hypothetical protein
MCHASLCCRETLFALKETFYRNDDTELIGLLESYSLAARQRAFPYILSGGCALSSDN